MPNTSGVRRRRRNLMMKNPHCHWCGVKLFEPKEPTEHKNGCPEFLATLDHLNSRETYPNGRPKQGTTVLSCQPCNLLHAYADRHKLAWPLESWQKELLNYRRNSASNSNYVYQAQC